MAKFFNLKWWTKKLVAGNMLWLWREMTLSRAKIIASITNIVMVRLVHYFKCVESCSPVASIFIGINGDMPLTKFLRWMPRVVVGKFRHIQLAKQLISMLIVEMLYSFCERQISLMYTNVIKIGSIAENGQHHHW